jgi:hypothetical protein
MEGIEAIIRAAFPAHPVPQPFFVTSEGRQQDIHQELESRIHGRAWTSLTLLDWRMVGSVPAFREYLMPQTFAYHVPSFLVGVISEPDFRDWALEAILPFNRRREPRGEWWTSFAAALTDPQRTAIRAFLAFQRDSVGYSFDLADEELVSSAESLWA